MGDEPLRVLDLGAGTGKLTRTLVALGHDVVAVEPSAPMLAQLRRALPHVEALEGGAEAIPVADARADAVLAGQAFHWFDPTRALPEIQRVLCPAGVLGVVWHVLDEAQLFVRRLNDLLPSSQGSEEPAAAIAASELFGSVEEAHFPWERRVDRDAFVDNVSTQSSVATLPPAERARVLAAVGELWDAEAGTEGLGLAYVAYAYRAERH
ncbi:MAG: class I SAM-dependent methyltransferase [Gaiellaceae bacterium]